MVLSPLLACLPALAQSIPASASAFFARYCVTCHNDAKQMAGLTLQTGQVNDAVWEKVLDRISSGRMPPPGEPTPAAAEIAPVTVWLSERLGHVASDPGRVTARRLNRAEYNNTVRDLLGVSLRPADAFPLDDAGYGFDSIGDVLSVSPLLMEKYMAAARQLSRVAVYGETFPNQPAKLVRLMTKKSQDDPTPGALSYSYRGALYGTYRFPVEGEYELRMRVGNYRPRDVATPRHRQLRGKRQLTPAEHREYEELNRTSYPPVKMITTFDGREVYSEIVEGNVDYQYAHGEALVRVKATAGEHSFRASFPEYASMGNPRDNVNLDGRRKLFIDYLDIVGPFRPSTTPPASRSRIFLCKEQTPACAERIIASLAGRAFRRAVTRDELGPLLALAASVRAKGDSFDESIRVAVQAILLSPDFLFRIERQPRGAEKAFALAGQELATRLSYFLWSSMPDDTLRRASLRDPVEMRRELRRMLADPRADQLVENFFGQWLGLRTLDKRKPDPAHFPIVDDELIESMHRETMLFARAIVREDRSILDLIDGPFTFLNGPLAAFYGVGGVKGEGFERVALDGSRRSGVLTHGSVLMLSSYATRTSPVLRGKWVLENLLGTPPPPPPPDVPALVEANLGKDAPLRKRLEQHRANPSCAVCHDQMDGIGFGLENYDASGAWRDRDGVFPIDSSGTLPGSGPFHTPAQLKQVLKQQQTMFTRNLTEKLMTYALGRGMEASDRPVLNEIAGRVAAQGYRFTVLLEEIVISKPFKLQKAIGGQDVQRASR
ncbi:MAG: DUF1592 domain-containing protein [Acidobacteria bacterium]|nr:DUF1592 domain-containing protein [Acidobacteriota bacterium]